MCKIGKSVQTWSPHNPIYDAIHSSQLSPWPQALDDCQFRSGDIESVHVRRQPCKCLLGSIWPAFGHNRSASYLKRPFVFRSHFSAQNREVNTYLISVFILTQSTSYNFLSASLICLLFALISTMNTKVLFSSIFFIALSVLRGWMITLWWSRRGTWGTDFRWYLGVRGSRRVLGRWKVVVCRILRALWEWTWRG